MTTDQPTDEQRATQLLELFHRDLLALVQRDEYQPMPHVVITGLLEVAGVLMRNGVRLEPSALPTLLGQLDHVRAHIMPDDGSGGPTETRH